DVDLLRPRRDEREEDLGRRLVRVVLEEVMLGRPVVLEADLVALDRGVDLAVVARVLVVPLRTMHLREDPELHDASCRPDASRIRGCELPFALSNCQPEFSVVQFGPCRRSRRTRRGRPATTS